jgi:hypothetical protein
MDKDEIKRIEAQIEFRRISEFQKYKEEFDKLGSTNSVFKDFLFVIAPFVLLLLT